MSDDFRLKERLKESGYKYTDQRKAVLDVLVNSCKSHLSIEEVYSLMKEENKDIGIATIYRTFVLLEKIGIVYKLDLDDGFSRYELIKENEDHRHHHLICSICANVSEVQEDLLDNLEDQILLKNKFLVKDHRVKFYGICENCQ